VACGAALGLALLSGCARESGPASVLVVVIDTLRADHVGAYGYERPTTPNLDRLEGGSWIRFEHAIAHSPWTLPSFASLLTSLPPPVHLAGERVAERKDGKTALHRLRDGVATAPRIFGREHGFRTAAFVNNPYLDPQFGLDAGFDVYDHVAGSNRDTRGAQLMVDHAIDWLARLGQRDRFFLLLHLFDPHQNYDPPTPYAERFLGSERAKERPFPGIYQRIKLKGFEPSGEQRKLLQDLYDGEIAHVDDQIARLLFFLESRGRLASSAVVITADHGEEFWDHGAFEHGHALYDELVRVPLWLKLPDESPLLSQLPQAGFGDRLVCHIDVLPTLLDVLGLSTEAPLMGRSVFAEREPAAPEACYLGSTLYGIEKRGVVKRNLKLIENLQTGAVELYDLAADPGEARDLAGERPDQAKALRAELELLEEDLKRLGESLGAAQVETLDPEMVERLRSMGYIR
jgi:arylsulfatase A-like enzyme